MLKHQEGFSSKNTLDLNESKLYSKLLDILFDPQIEMTMKSFRVPVVYQDMKTIIIK